MWWRCGGRGSRQATGEAEGEGGWLIAVAGVVGWRVAGWRGGLVRRTGGAGAGEHGQLLVCGKYHLGRSSIIIVLFNCILELKAYNFL